MSMSVPLSTPLLPKTDIDQIRNLRADTPNAEKAKLKAATKEFESYFMYYMLKTMRETVPEQEVTDGSGSKGMGKDMFQDMFDSEIAKKITTVNGRSISDILYKSLEKVIDARGIPQGRQGMIPLTVPEKAPLKLQDEGVKIQQTKNKFIERDDKQTFRINRTADIVRTDPIISKYGRYINEAAAESGLDSALITSVIRAESNGVADAVSPAGAKGLMQLLDSTAREVGVDNSLDPRSNIRGGSKYLSRMIDRFGDLKLGLAAYNAGPGNVEKYGGIPPFKETQDYVKRVEQYMTAHSTQHSGKGLK